MIPDAQDLRHLLDDVVPVTGPDIGPDRAALLKLVRQERSRLHRARAMYAVVAIASAAMLLFHRPVTRETIPQPVGPPVAAPIVINQVDDQQFLALLKDAPVALMEWPDGQRTLLVMER